MSVAMMEK